MASNRQLVGENQKWKISIVNAVRSHSGTLPQRVERHSIVQWTAGGKWPFGRMFGPSGAQRRWRATARRHSAPRWASVLAAMPVEQDYSAEETTAPGLLPAEPADRLTKPLMRFLRIEAAAGDVLLL